VLDALRTLRRELDALLESLKGMSGVFVTSAAVRRRIEEFYLSWSNFRPLLESSQVPQAVIRRAENLTKDIIRLSAGKNRRDRYLRKFGALRRVLGKELLLEIAKLPPPTGTEGNTARVIRRSMVPEIPGLTNDLIPNALYGWIEEMRNFLRQNTYDRNVFIMVAYKAELDALISDIEQTLTGLGLNPIVARDHRITNDLYNPLACLLCCQFGVAIFDKGESKQLHNANIVYELAMMQILKRQCVILKHQRLKTMPSDFLHILHEPYKTPDDAVKAVKSWWRRLQKIQ